MSEAAPLLTGIMPVAPTPFLNDETLDVDGTRQIADFLIDAEVDGICILANYSEQFSLTDSERETVMTETLRRVDGRVPVCVTTSHYTTRIAVDRSRRAADAGAAMVMLMPPFFGATMTVGEQGVYDFFAEVCGAVDCDVMIQDAPMSPTPMSVPLLARMAADFANIRYVKAEVARSADKIRAIKAAAGDDLPGLFDGEEGVTLIHDLEAGAIGTMTSAAFPERLGDAARSWLAGDKEAGVAIWEDTLALVQIENRQCGLSAAKILMAEGGVIASARTRAPFPATHPDSARQLIELARRKDAYVLSWAA